MTRQYHDHNNSLLLSWFVTLTPRDLIKPSVYKRNLKYIRAKSDKPTQPTNQPVLYYNNPVHHIMSYRTPIAS